MPFLTFLSFLPPPAARQGLTRSPQTGPILPARATLGPVAQRQNGRAGAKASRAPALPVPRPHALSAPSSHNSRLRGHGDQHQQGAAARAAEEAAEKETDMAPMALLWVFAMVRSRSVQADFVQFAFVPFLVR